MGKLTVGWENIRFAEGLLSVKLLLDVDNGGFLPNMGALVNELFWAEFFPNKLAGWENGSEPPKILPFSSLFFG